MNFFFHSKSPPLIVISQTTLVEKKDIHPPIGNRPRVFYYLEVVEFFGSYFEITSPKLFGFWYRAFRNWFALKKRMNHDGLVKGRQSRHPGESRGPEDGFRLSPE
jgi:hypothetical protein